MVAARCVRLGLQGLMLTVLAAAASAGAVSGVPAEDDVRGIVRARRTASIASDLAVPVARINARVGESFTAGDTLVSFDCRRHEAEHQAALAGRKEMQIALENSSYLSERRAAGKLDVAIAEARVERAAAEVAALEWRLSQCAIVAPFDGKVGELAIEEHEIPVAGRPIITILDARDPEIELIVPSRWLSWIRPGRAFRFHIDETGADMGASVSRVGAQVDPVSQSVVVFGEFLGDAAAVTAGMSGSARFAGEALR